MTAGSTLVRTVHKDFILPTCSGRIPSLLVFSMKNSLENRRERSNFQWEVESHVYQCVLRYQQCRSIEIHQYIPLYPCRKDRRSVLRGLANIPLWAGQSSEALNHKLRSMRSNLAPPCFKYSWILCGVLYIYARPDPRSLTYESFPFDLKRQWEECQD